MDIVQSLIGCDKSRFLADFRGDTSFVGEYEDTLKAKGAFSVALFNDYTQVAARLGYLKIVNGGAYVEVGSSNHVNLQFIWRHFYSGYSLIMNSTHLFVQSISDICHHLSYSLGVSAQANAYFTPANSTAFTLHSDNHDVIVLQLFGEKHWEVQDDSLPHHELTLKAGQSLYIPRGVKHRAKTHTCSSLHLTIGLKNISQQDLVRQLLGQGGELAENISNELFYDESLSQQIFGSIDETLGNVVVSEQSVRRAISELRRGVARAQCKGVSVYHPALNFSQVIFESYIPFTYSYVSNGEVVKVEQGTIGVSFSSSEWEAVTLIQRHETMPITELSAMFPSLDDSFYERLSVLNLVRFE